ncbi:MAG: Required for respiratory growth protein 9 mitochondrial [Phylliscum demangeonii]|nr:MAG: Required for respiratory growth protein 9 mitochondrial [Phylliscum demangeonii]
MPEAQHEPDVAIQKESKTDVRTVQEKVEEEVVGGLVRTSARGTLKPPVTQPASYPGHDVNAGTGGAFMELTPENVEAIASQASETRAVALAKAAEAEAASAKAAAAKAAKAKAATAKAASGKTAPGKAASRNTASADKITRSGPSKRKDESAINSPPVSHWTPLPTQDGKGRPSRVKGKPTSSDAEPAEAAPRPRERWRVEKEAIKRKLNGAHWMPRKRLSPDALDGIRALHAQYPDQFTTPVLAQQFEISPDAIRRILKSQWRPSAEEAEDRRARWERRGQQVWSRYVTLGIKAPRKWRDMGILRRRNPDGSIALGGENPSLDWRSRQSSPSKAATKDAPVSDKAAPLPTRIKPKLEGRVQVLKGANGNDAFFASAVS